MKTIVKLLKKYPRYNTVKQKGEDPDKYSKPLGEKHCEMWSNKGKFKTLKWNPLNKLETIIDGVKFIFTPDSITNCFVGSRRKALIDKELRVEKDWIEELGDDVDSLIKDYKDTDYTIGSSIIFPVQIGDKRIGYTMNCARGLNYKVHDRIDYTLECIRRYYKKIDDNPLQNALERSAPFFDLFDSFEDYVDFFFLDDLVDADGNVICFTGKIDFKHPFPDDKEQYVQYIENTMEFVLKRNKRIYKKED